MARKAAWILSILVLGNTGLLGLYHGLTELPDAQTTLQRSVTTGVLVYGVLGLAALAALFARHSWAVWLTIAWAIVVTYVASAAAPAYAGDEATVGGTIGAGVGAAIIGLGIVWCARSITRPASLHDRVQAANDAR